MSDNTHEPPMKSSDEATKEQLGLAVQQGETYVKALNHMVEKVANDGGEQRTGDYIIGYAVEEAEGMYELNNGELTWKAPEDENVHVEVSVRDGSDNRFIPGLTVHATLSKDGNTVDTKQLPFLWHPWLYHYGLNWRVPGDGTYQLKVKVEPSLFMRHDKKNGKRYAKAVEVTFEDVEIETGQD